MQSRHLTLASAPALLMFRESPEENARQGTILFYHGFGESKEAYETVLARFAEAGFLAIGIDGIGHGERRYPDFDQRFPPPEPRLLGNAQLEAAFLDVVQQTAAEIPSILNTLIEQKWARPGQIGISGISFGGLVTYAAVIADKRIEAAVPVVGSPQWKLPRTASPHLHHDLFYPTALLSQTAGKDTNQLPSTVREFHKQLAPYYEQAPERLCSIEYPDSFHDLSQEDWEQAWNRARDWFETFLSRKNS